MSYRFDTRLYVQTRSEVGSFRVRIDGDGVHVGRALLLPRKEILGAVALPITGSQFLRVFVVQKKNGAAVPWTFDVANRSDADVMLRELRAGLEQQALELQLDGGAFGGAAFMCGIAFTIGGSFAAWHAGWPRAILGIFAFATGVSLLGAYVADTRVVVAGRDGIVVRRIWGHRFYPYADIARLERRNGRVEIVLRSGRVVPLWVVGDSPFFLNGGNLIDEDALKTLFHLRIEQAMSAHAAIDHDARPATGPECVVSYREHAAPRADLRDVIVDSHRNDAARVAAALALREREGKDEVSDIAQSLASPRLRVALEGVARGEDESQVARKLEKTR